MWHNSISKDTIDINFSYLHVKSKRKFKLLKAKYYIHVSTSHECGGTQGYKPEFRFVFDSLSNDWMLL